MFRRHRAATIGAGATILAAIIAAVALVVSSNSPAGSVTQDTKNSTVFNGIQGDVTYGDPKDDLAGWVDTPPVGSGPYMFRVYNTVYEGQDLGLRVRSCNQKSCGCEFSKCELRGIAMAGASLYAECQFDSGFNGGEGDLPSVWLKVRWPTNDPGDMGANVGGQNDPYRLWALKAYAQPAGHNGDIPLCQSGN